MRILAVLLLLGGCSFDSGGLASKVNGGGTDGRVADGALIDGGMSVDAADGGVLDAGDSAVLQPDARVDAGPMCTPASQRCGGGGTLDTCRGDGTGFSSIACTYGCSAAPSPHCSLFYPQPPVLLGDLDAIGLTANITVPVGATFNTATGQIGYGTIVAPMTLRGSNADPNTREIVNGIAFHVASNGTGPKLAIWSFNGVSFPEGAMANANQTRFVGGNAIALVSTTNLTLNGELEVNCFANAFVGGGITAAGSGGFPGAPTSGGDGMGLGGGMTANNQAGGGGAGYGATGGKGGNHGGDMGGTGGAVYGGVSLNPLVGGAGGGAGEGGTGSGGGGGGAVQLVAAGTISIGGGVALRGGVNVAGCGGHVGGNNGGGGGGGSGGAILLEAPTVNLAARATLAANGGAGGGGDSSSDATGAGGVGAFSAQRATGGTGGSNGGTGGQGGAAGNPGGQNATNGSQGGGGGGGAVGRIRINTSSGAATTDAAAILSPRLTDNLATQGAIDLH